MMCFFFFFFNDTATTEIYTLSLHDALPIFQAILVLPMALRIFITGMYIPIITLRSVSFLGITDRKSTRLNSSHVRISYAVFCLKKKKINNKSILSLLKKELETQNNT